MKKAAVFTAAFFVPGHQGPDEKLNRPKLALFSSKALPRNKLTDMGFFRSKGATGQSLTA
ncbi:hypothetical protein CSA56_11490 [candidate division KSB3 bacterium]|uniref:Uncharacterized protein n=1 Tax=candidate division KSB3 bacterium TaxID=2044937 RepID=A0A2G6KD04_9BACT|nr:MAG: hypothetical protein CSA56_11490 [candidate division KSB3 bacterium]